MLLMYVKWKCKRHVMSIRRQRIDEDKKPPIKLCVDLNITLGIQV